MIGLRALAVLFTGTTQALIAPPLSWTALHWVSWIPFLWALEGQGGRRRFGLGWLMGASALASIFYWIVGTVQRFSNLPTPLAIVVMLLFAGAWGLYGGVFAVAYPHVKRWAGPAWPFAVAALLVACELVNPQLFPFYQGVAHYENPLLFQISTLTGVRGVSFLVLVVNGLGWAAIEALVLRRGSVRGRHLVWLAGVTATLLVALAIYGTVRLRWIDRLEREAPVLRVGLIQIGMGIEERSRRTREDRMGILDEYLEESRAAARRGADVVIWPEGASPYRVTGRRGRRILAMAADEGVEAWIGGLSVERDPETREPMYYNSAFRIDAEGTLRGRYDKNILLPFGEFMPGRRLVPRLAARIEGVGNFHAGDELVVFESPWTPFNVLICYEAIRASLVRRNVLAGSRFFVTITNDAWFGDTSCPSQHLMLTANRCAEHGIPMVRVATTGLSAVIDARGTVVEQTEVFAKDVRVVDVPLVYAPTLYTRVGDLFSWLCLAVTLFAVTSRAVAARRARRVGEPPVDVPRPGGEASRQRQRSKGGRSRRKGRGRRR